MMLTPSPDINSESDVEQKILYPILTLPEPTGLGIPGKHIFTKPNLRDLVIDKGKSKKSYFPDYVVSYLGVPVLVAEAKAPGENLHEALREARLYANEINSRFRDETNPVKFVLACNGAHLLVGTNLDDQPFVDIPVEAVGASNLQFTEALNSIGWRSLEKWAESQVKSLRATRYWMPRKLIGGIAAQNEEIGLNSFGTTIKSDFRGLFDPETLEERNLIATECYIPSKRRDRYVDAIDRTFRAVVLPSEKHATTLEDSEKPSQIISKLRQGKQLTNQVMLLIGAAGAGKTTFVDHLRAKALPTDLKRSTRWIHLNMNAAPVSREDIYQWLRKEIISNLRSEFPKIDFYELDSLRQIFREELEKFRKGPGRLYEANKEKYDEKTAEVLEKCLTDEHYVAQSFCRFASKKENALPVIVLDNCDKRTKDEQLLMFEAAQWLKTQFNAMVFLPLREETYDNNHMIPPLDTAVKDLTFRIEPPRFDLILKSRVDYAIRMLRENPSKKFSYDLPNSMRATYTAADKVAYLTSILRSVFDTDFHVRRLLIGLSGRNMRRAMEIFLEFCSSGHISEDHIVKMVQSNGSYSLPMSVVSKVLMRPKKRYYSSDASYVVNVFGANINDRRMNSFVRVGILRFLSVASKEREGSRISGYARGHEIFKELQKFGVSEDVLLREVNYLANAHCIVSEDYRISGIALDDLITLGPAGRTHLYLLNNIYYIAAISEDCWFRDEAVAAAIAERVRNPALQFENRTLLRNAKAVTAELEREGSELIQEFSAVFGDTDYSDLVSVSSLFRTIFEKEKQFVGAWAGLEERFPVGKAIEGRVVNKKQFGLFVELQPGLNGLVHTSKLSEGDKRKAVGDEIDVVILDVDPFSQKIALSSLC